MSAVNVRTCPTAVDNRDISYIRIGYELLGKRTHGHSRMTPRTGRTKCLRLQARRTYDRVLRGRRKVPINDRNRVRALLTQCECLDPV